MRRVYIINLTLKVDLWMKCLQQAGYKAFSVCQI